MRLLADIFTPQKRSWVMSRIRSKDTKIEIKIADLLKENKIHYRRFPNIFGSPDFVIEKRILVFCDGDFLARIPIQLEKKAAEKVLARQDRAQHET